MDKTKDIRIYALKQLEQIKDSRSEFIEHLKECGLDKEKIRYCCLEVPGVKE